MTRARTTAWARASVVLAIAGCAAAPAPRPPPRTNATWETTSWEDRHQTMTFAVLPNMARVWQRFEGTAYPTLTCRRCHGANAEDVAYKMPNDLPALDPKETESVPSDPRRAKIAKFMRDEVVPQMIELLDARADGPRAFGCFTCHPVKR